MHRKQSAAVSATHKLQNCAHNAVSCSVQLLILPETLNRACGRVSLSGKRECPIDLYFTIDTSETIALQESPPGALVESIKVCLLFSYLLNNIIVFITLYIQLGPYILGKREKSLVLYIASMSFEQNI